MKTIRGMRSAEFCKISLHIWIDWMITSRIPLSFVKWCWNAFGTIWHMKKRGLSRFQPRSWELKRTILLKASLKDVPEGTRQRQDEEPEDDYKYAFDLQNQPQDAWGSCDSKELGNCTDREGERVNYFVSSGFGMTDLDIEQWHNRTGTARFGIIVSRDFSSFEHVNVTRQVNEHASITSKWLYLTQIWIIPGLQTQESGTFF